MTPSPGLQWTSLPPTIHAASNRLGAEGHVIRSLLLLPNKSPNHRAVVSTSLRTRRTIPRREQAILVRRHLKVLVQRLAGLGPKGHPVFRVLRVLQHCRGAQDRPRGLPRNVNVIIQNVRVQIHRCNPGANQGHNASLVTTQDRSRKPVELLGIGVRVVVINRIIQDNEISAPTINASTDTHSNNARVFSCLVRRIQVPIRQIDQ